MPVSLAAAANGKAVFGVEFDGAGEVGDGLGRGFGLSRATAYRYIDEVAVVLPARAQGCREALERPLAEGIPYVILDGKLFRCPP